jgi:hypothetical protein
MNSIDYNAKLDQIMVSVHSFNEIWIIDHSTTTQEAAEHRGGRYGQGGDLLYRWGNPRAYLAGEAKDQTLFAQHDARWIRDGVPGAGHMLVFNNGSGRPDGRYSSVLEVVLPVDSGGRYLREPGKAFAPAAIQWEYTAPRKDDFFAGHLSGAQRLANGNTLICSGEEARAFEVSPAGQTVWEYVNPYRPGQGTGRGPHSAQTQPAQRPLRVRPPASGPVALEPTGPAGPGSGGPLGGPDLGLFRVRRYTPDYPGVHRVLEAKAASGSGGS